jgi:tetratricopeptide (TPR) repeat protein
MKDTRMANEGVGKFQELRQLLERSPGDYLALCRLGFEKQQQGRLEESRQSYEAAFSIAPPSPELAHHLGVVCHRLGDPARARECLERALALFPDPLDTLATLDELAQVCQESGDLDAALACYEKALRIDPRHCRAFSGMGWAFSNAGWDEDAIRAFETALSIEPDQPEATNGLGVLYKRQGRFDRAMACFERALALRPGDTGLQHNRAMVLGALGRRDEEEAVYRKILAHDPDEGDAHFGLASLLLLTGRLAEGWREYEWRFASRQASQSVRKPSSSLPRWRGEAVTRESSGLVIYAEQGFGDGIQFSRFVSLAARRFGHVCLQTRQPLLKLFAHSFGALAEVVAEAPDERGYTHHCPLLSLPLAFGATLENLPADVPYLAPPLECVAKWSARLASQRRETRRPFSGRRVGLAWSGNEGYAAQRFRALSLKQLAPLFEVDGIDWVSLQKGGAAGQIAREGLTDRIFDAMDEVEDFADTAAIIANLDLVISVDTAVLHLAGAMNQPVWLLNRFDTDWRWMLERTDSPWYPTLRIFRQRQSRQWEPALHDLACALRSTIQENHERP